MPAVRWAAFLVAFLLSLGAAAGSLLIPSVVALQLLLNPGFEDFGPSGPAAWVVDGAAASPVSAPAVAGTALRIESSLTEARVTQVVPALAGAGYAGSVRVAAGPNARFAALRLEFLDASFAPLDTVEDQHTLGAAFSLLSVATTAPLHTAWARVVVRVGPDSPGTFVAFVDDAALTETPAGATQTPTATNTPTAAVSSTPTSTPSTASPSQTTSPESATPTRTPTLTRTPTPARTPTSTRTPTPTRTLSPPRQPSPTSAPGGSAAQPTASRSPGAPPSGPFGGLLENGNFEDTALAKPLFWSKFGGELGLTSGAYRGRSAATLSSQGGSTKWLHQVAGVSPGAWYVAQAFARIDSGPGEVFLRLTWYADPDGGGEALDQVDSGALSSSGWASITTQPAQAPPQATSVRVRLMLRASAPAAAAFDDVSLLEVEPPASTAGTVTAATPPARTPAAPQRSPSGRPATSASTDPSTAGLRLSEVLINSPGSGNDSASEWVELVNVGHLPIDTAGWRLGDADELDDLPHADVAPGAYLIVAARSARLPSGVALIRPADGQIGRGLANGGDSVRLVAPDGSLVDALSYGTDTSVFEPAPEAPVSGATLGVRDPHGEPAGENWASTQRPTPGEPNVFPVTPPGSNKKSGVANRLAPEPAAAGRDAESNTAVLLTLSAAVIAAFVGGSALVIHRTWPRLRRRFPRGR